MILQVQPRWMTCHSLMQFASPVGEGQKRAHSVAVDGFSPFFFSQSNSHNNSFLCVHCKAFSELWRKTSDKVNSTIYFRNTRIQQIMGLHKHWRKQKGEKEIHFMNSLPDTSCHHFPLIRDSYQTSSQVSVSLLSWFDWWESRRVYRNTASTQRLPYGLCV